MLVTIVVFASAAEIWNVSRIKIHTVFTNVSQNLRVYTCDRLVFFVCEKMLKFVQIYLINILIFCKRYAILPLVKQPGEISLGNNKEETPYEETH